MTFLHIFYNSLYYFTAMKIILAQGNPGDQYAATRHNVGFQVVDLFAQQHETEFKAKPKFFAAIAEVSINGDKVLLVKPTTFYNETGKTARALIDFYKIDAAEDLLVVHDDLALPFTTLRTRQSGSDAGNNGIKSLNAHVGSSYARLRIGIYNDLRDAIDDADFVLSRFTKAEQATLDETILPKASTIVTSFIAGSFETTTHS